MTKQVSEAELVGHPSGNGAPEEAAGVDELRAEAARLRLENEALRGRTESGRRPHHRVRLAGAIALLVVAWIATVSSVLAIWAHDEIYDQNTYLSTVAPLAQDPAVQSAVANYLLFQFTSNVNVEDAARSALPPKADFLAAPIANAVNGFVQSRITNFVHSDRFQSLWLFINKTLQLQLVNFLLDKPGAIQIQDNKLLLNLAPVFAAVQQNLQSTRLDLLTKLPLDRINTQFPIADAGSLEQIRDQINLLNTLVVVLPLIALVAFAGALVVSPNRRRTLLIAGLGVAASMALVGVLLALIRGAYLDHATSPHLPRDAAAAIFDIIVVFFRNSIRLVFAIGLLVALGAYLAGPSSVAVWLRGAIRRASVGVRDWAEGRGWRTGRAGIWVGAHKMPLRVAAVAIASVALLLWDQPTAGVVLAIAIIVAVVMVLIEFFGRSPRPSIPAA